MSLFTCNFEFAGGTYISQVRAASAESAAQAWVSTVDVQSVPGLGQAGLAQIQAAVAQEPPVPVSGMIGVWCSTFALSRGLALLNLVETSET